MSPHLLMTRPQHQLQTTLIATAESARIAADAKTLLLEDYKELMRKAQLLFEQYEQLFEQLLYEYDCSYRHLLQQEQKFQKYQKYQQLEQQYLISYYQLEDKYEEEDALLRKRYQAAIHAFKAAATTTVR